MRAGWLVLPLLLVTGALFMLPLAGTLWSAAADPEMRAALPRAAAALRAWDGEGLPNEAVAAALVEELPSAERAQALGALSRRLNFEQPGLRALLLRTARSNLSAPYAAALAALDPRWADPATWRLLRDASGAVTPLYLLRALDLHRDASGSITTLPPQERVFRPMFARTLSVALTVTVLCVLLGYPVAAALAGLSPAWARVGLALVLLPFWTSVLVRTTAWFVLLQREGPVNALLQALRVTDGPVGLVFTRFAVVLAMVHVLLPFVVLPLYGVMIRLDRRLMRAAASLGAGAARSFLRVYLPLTLPGVAAGAAMVFLLSVGFYVTPVLLGGNGDQMVGTFISNYLNEQANVGMAAALAVLLLVATALVVVSARGSLSLARGLRQ